MDFKDFKALSGLRESVFDSNPAPLQEETQADVPAIDSHFQRLFEADAFMRHCVVGTMTGDSPVDNPFAVCTAQGQKSGIYKKGSRDLTKKGQKVAAKHEKHPAAKATDKEYARLALKKTPEEYEKAQKKERLSEDHHVKIKDGSNKGHGYYQLKTEDGKVVNFRNKEHMERYKAKQKRKKAWEKAQKDMSEALTDPNPTMAIDPSTGEAYIRQLRPKWRGARDINLYDEDWPLRGLLSAIGKGAKKGVIIRGPYNRLMDVFLHARRRGVLPTKGHPRQGLLYYGGGGLRYAKDDWSEDVSEDISESRESFSRWLESRARELGVLDSGRTLYTVDVPQVDSVIDFAEQSGAAVVHVPDRKYVFLRFADGDVAIKRLKNAYAVMTPPLAG